MKLRFLGAEYPYFPKSVTVSEGEVMGKYRGVPWRAKRYSTPSILKPSILKEDVTLYFPGRSYQSHSQRYSLKAENRPGERI